MPTTGTGSGKSLSYFVPIVDDVLRRRTASNTRGISAIVVYPMNGLCNSQMDELEKFLRFGYPKGQEPVRFARYTGQESTEDRQAFANQIRRRVSVAGDTWPLDEVVMRLSGVQHWLWRAVDRHGTVLDSLVQRRRDKQAAKQRPGKLLKKQCRPPRVMVTDKLASYAAAQQEIMPGVAHRQHKGLNSRAENSHQPTRRRERQMKCCKSAGHAQRCLAAHDGIQQPLPPLSPSPPCRPVSRRSSPSLPDLGRDHRCCHCGVTQDAPRPGLRPCRTYGPTC